MDAAMIEVMVQYGAVGMVAAVLLVVEVRRGHRMERRLQEFDEQVIQLVRNNTEAMMTLSHSFAANAAAMTALTAEMRLRPCMDDRLRNH